MCRGEGVILPILFHTIVTIILFQVVGLYTVKVSSYASMAALLKSLECHTFVQASVFLRIGHLGKVTILIVFPLPLEG